MSGHHARCPNAFEEALALHDEALKRRCKRLCQETAGRLANDGEDIWQTAKINAYHGYAHFKPGTNFRTWLFTIATNTFIDAIRREQRDKSHSGTPDTNETPLENRFFQSETDPATIYIRTEQCDQIWAAVDALSSNQQLVFKMCELERLSYRQCAERLALSENSIGTILYRAKKKLRDLLEPQLYGEMGFEKEQRG